LRRRGGSNASPGKLAVAGYAGYDIREQAVLVGWFVLSVLSNL
jgi:hypothetical protein